MIQTEKIINYDSPEAAKKKTLTGWVGGGRFWGEDEHMARWSGCTHIQCECGAWTPKGYTHCEECRHKRTIERYNALPIKEWDLIEPICLYDGDKYFFSEEDLIEWCDEEEIKPEDLMLVICKPNYMGQIDSSIWESEMPEDGEIPDELQKLLDKVNEYLKTAAPLSYSPGKIRVSYTPSPNQ